MKHLGHSVLAIGLIALALSQALADMPSLQFPGDDLPIHLRLAIQVDGRSPEARWEAFLDRWFEALDRDGDGLLSAAEAGHAFPLPLADRREAVLEFKALDANGDQRGSRAELKSFYLFAGFTPEIVTSVRPAVETVAASETLFVQFDRDHDGVLSKAELERSSAILRRLDQNEDDVLAANELLPLPRFGPTTAHLNVISVLPTESSDAELQLVLGANPQPPKLVAARGDIVRLFESPGGTVRLKLGGSYCTLLATTDPKQRAFKAARSFYRAQFEAAFKPGTLVEKPQLERDPGMQALVGMFDPADRDADGRLSLAELASFFDLVEQGALCQTMVTVFDRGRNLFDCLDQDQDGRLDARELNASSRVLAAEHAGRPLTRDRVPRQYQLLVEQGTPATSFGPLPIPRPAKRPIADTPITATGPKWFQAQDRNADGFVVPWEFVGPPTLFERLDANHDDSLDAGEAERAGRQLGLDEETQLNRRSRRSQRRKRRGTVEKSEPNESSSLRPSRTSVQTLLHA